MLSVTDSNVRIFGGREISIPQHQRNSYANICTLQTDLDLVLLEVLEDAEHQPRKRYTLTTVSYRLSDQEPVTPLLESLEELDLHIAANMNDIIQEYLFGFVEEDLELSQVSA